MVSSCFPLFLFVAVGFWHVIACASLGSCYSAVIALLSLVL